MVSYTDPDNDNDKHTIEESAAAPEDAGARDHLPSPRCLPRQAKEEADDNGRRELFPGSKATAREAYVGLGPSMLSSGLKSYAASGDDMALDHCGTLTPAAAVSQAEHQEHTSLQGLPVPEGNLQRGGWRDLAASGDPPRWIKKEEPEGESPLRAATGAGTSTSSQPGDLDRMVVKRELAAQHASRMALEPSEATSAAAEMERPTKKLRNAGDPDVWWECPACEYLVRHSSDHVGNGCIRSRLRQAHLAAEHPELDAQALVNRQYRRPGDPDISGDEMQHWVMAEKQKGAYNSRQQKVTNFIDKYKGKHTLTVRGYSVVCATCGWHGKFPGEGKVPSDFVPKACKGRVASLPPAHHRGGARTKVRSQQGGWLSRKSTARNGFCLWHSLASFIDHSAGRIKRCALQHLSTQQTEAWGEWTLEEHALYDTGESWRDYVKALKCGRIWPGVMEIRATAHRFGRHIEVFETDTTGTVALPLFAEGLEYAGQHEAGSIKLQYVDKCHYEPLISVAQCTRLPAPALGEHGDPEHMDDKEPTSEESETTGTLTFVYANISSYNKNRHEVWQFAELHNADVLAVTETRLRTGFHIVAMEAGGRGYATPHFSPPRPLKADCSGPREGGLFATAKVPRAIRKLEMVQDELALSLAEDDVMHFRVQLGASKIGGLHLLVVYCNRHDEDLREAIFEFGFTLGEVPVIIVGDFNDPSSSRKPGSATNKAAATGYWHPLLGDEDATTHKAGIRGQNADLVFANGWALGLVRSCTVDYANPFVNHYGIVLKLHEHRRPPLVLKPTDTNSYVSMATRLDANEKRAIYESVLDEEDSDEICQSIVQGDLEAAWTLWCQRAEQVLSSGEGDSPAQPGGKRAKGSMVTFAWQPAWCSRPRGTPAHLARLLLRLRRLRELCILGELTLGAEGANLFVKIRQRLVDLGIDDFHDITFAALDQATCEATLNKTAKHLQKLSAELKKKAILVWRDRVADSFSQAAKWLRGRFKEYKPLTTLDDSEGGTATHAQDVADELLYRCRAKFETNSCDMDPAGLEAILISLDTGQKHKIYDITGDELRWRACTKKPNGAPGWDGWRPAELLLLPRQMWDLLAAIFNEIEATRRWPKALAQAFHVGLLKDEKEIGPYPRIRVRLIAVLPILTRAWDGARAARATDWLLKWAPGELHGGIPTRGTLTAAVPVTACFMECAAAGRPLSGLSLDYADAFDRLPTEESFEVMHRLGLDERLTETATGLYEVMTRYVTTTYGASAGPFKGIVGVIQGLAMSVVIMNVWMALYVLYIKLKMGTQVWDHEWITMSIYLDDRNILASTVACLFEIMRHTTYFDKVIGAILNVAKTQLYGSQEGDLLALLALFPAATVRRRAWSLGAPTTTGFGLDDDFVAEAKVLARYLDAGKKAKIAAALPFQMRVRVMTSVIPMTYGFGIEFYARQRKWEQQIVATMYDSLTGGTRPFGSQLVLWTVITKGHNLHPWYLRLRQLTSFMRLAHDFKRGLYEALWANPPRESPFAFLVQHLKLLGCRWSAPTVYTATTLGHDTPWTVDFATCSRSVLDHSLREIWRIAMARVPSKRKDHEGAEFGIDKASTMAYHDSLDDYFRRGWLRTLLLGDMKTPARMLAGRYLSEDEAKCPHCPAVDGNGHRLSCPANEDLRSKYDFTLEALAALPVCLSRCGLMPTTLPAELQTGDRARRHLARRVQSLQIDIQMRCFAHPATAATMELALLRSRAKKHVLEGGEPEDPELERQHLKKLLKGNQKRGEPPS